MKNDGLVVLSNKTGERFARRVAEYASGKYVGTERRGHPDGEPYLHVMETIRGADVFYICPYYPNPMERHTENLLMVDAIKHASPGSLTVVPTYLGFMRSDWKDKSRVPIASRVVAETLEAAGADRILTMHLHARQIQGMFRIPMDVLESLDVLKEWVQELGYAGDNLVAVSPDAGGTKYAESGAGVIAAKDLGMIWKRRITGDDVDSHHFAGDVEGKVVIMPDDQLSTGTSLRKGAKRLKEMHKALKVYGFATHGIFAPSKGQPSEELLMEDRYLDGIVVTDTIPRPDEWIEKYKGKIEVRSVVNNFGEAIKRIHGNEGLSDLFQY